MTSTIRRASPPTPWLATWFCAFLFACGSGGTGSSGGGRPGEDGGSPPPDGTTGTDGAPMDDAGSDARLPDAGGDRDATVPPDGARPLDASLPPPPSDWPDSRGWRWVRSNPPFVSALTVRMGTPPAAAVDRYLDDFGATAIHLWEDGLPTAIAGWLAVRPGTPWVSWVAANGNSVTNRRVIGGITPGPERIGYQVGDEPRDEAHFMEHLTGLQRVGNADPAGLRILNFSYDPAVEGNFVERACDTGLVDIVSYDLYSRSNGFYEKLAYFREKALECGVPYWRYFEAYRASDKPVQAESDMRWAALTGITYGYTGHTWFLYLVRGGDAEGIPTTLFDRTDDWNATPTERFTWASRINRELVNYGRAVAHLLSRDVAWVTDTPVSGVWPPDAVPPFEPRMDPFLRELTFSEPGSVLDSHNALLGFFVDRYGDRYVVVQNPNHADGSFPTNKEDRLQGTLRFDFSGAGALGVDPSAVLVLDGRTGRVARRPLSDGTLEIDIAPGDILFFKYDTGRPFAGYGR